MRKLWYYYWFKRHECMALENDAMFQDQKAADYHWGRADYYKGRMNNV